jgi:hypothetical protein
MPSQFTADQLDFELARRDAFTARRLKRPIHGEWTTVAVVQKELDATPVTHPDRDWREWELALAERQALIAPTRRFFRIDRSTPPAAA